ncbi:DUF1493 family protein [Pantoea vagans]
MGPVQKTCAGSLPDFTLGMVIESAKASTWLNDQF